MKRLLLIATLVGCGGEYVPSLVTTVRVQGLTCAEVNRLAIYALDPQKKSGGLLTQVELVGTATADPTLQPGVDDEVVILADTSIEDPCGGASVTLEDVLAGENRIVFVEALSAANNIVGRGFTTVTVEDGETAKADVTVYETN